MKRIMTIGAAAIMALAFTAFAGVASASVSKIASGHYPAAINGVAGGNHQLMTNMGEMSCKTPTFTASASEALETLSAAPETSCSAFGSSGPMEMNGCKFEFHPGAETTFGTFGGSFDIGPAGCGPIRLKAWTCDITIGSQSGFTATYQNIGAGSSSEVLISAAATGLKYTQSNSGCGGKGTFENGQYHGSWNARGNFEESPSALYVAPNHAPMFEAAQYPVTFAGEQAATNKHVFSAGPGKEVKCEKVSFAGAGSAASTTAALTPTYSTCTAFGIYAAVTMNGCSYAYDAGKSLSRDEFSGSVSLSCPKGNFVRVKTGTCEVQISGETGVGSAAYTNSTEGGYGSITMNTSISGMKYAVTQDGIGCPLAGKGSFEDGSYTGGTVLQGKNGAGALQNIRIGGL